MLHAYKMTKKILGWIALIIGTGVNIYNLFAIIIAWFNRKRGGFLVTIFAVLLIISSDPTVKEMIWQPFVLLIVGLILLYEVYYNKRISKKEEIQ